MLNVITGLSHVITLYDVMSDDQQITYVFLI